MGAILANEELDDRMRELLPVNERYSRHYRRSPRCTRPRAASAVRKKQSAEDRRKAYLVETERFALYVAEFGPLPKGKNHGQI